jgi:hypothetical protein
MIRESLTKTQQRFPGCGINIWQQEFLNSGLYSLANNIATIRIEFFEIYMGVRVGKHGTKVHNAV